MSNECEHGQLARQCEQCERLKELAAARAELAEAQALASKQEDELTKVWFVLRGFGLHPGRTDDRLSSVIWSAIHNMSEELERERMRLAACGVVALANTPESAARARQMKDEYRSASCDDVANAVDEQMRLRAELERAMRVVEAAVAYGKAEGSEALFQLMTLEHAVQEWEAGR